MKKTILAMLLAVVALVGCEEAKAGAAYAQLSSGIPQMDTTVMVEHTDGISGLAVVGKKVIVHQPGTYFVVYAPQTGAYAGCSNYYLQVNGVDVDNSNVRVCQAAGETNVVVSQSVLELKKDDALTFVTSGPLGVQATFPAGEPVVPSVIVTVFKL